jgi:hypothetical protein
MMFVFGANSAATGYNLTRSLRFRASATAYLSRTPASATNRKTWTVSCWVKRGRLATGTEQVIFSSNNGSTFTELNYLASSDVLRLNLSAGGSAYFFDTTAVFRDPSAWYHIVVAVDTTQATATDRMKVYINGVQQVGTNNSPAQNYDTDWNRAQNAFIGSRTASTWFNDFYLTEFNNIDGLQLTPSSFGSTNALTGVWQPARYTGTYGTNGFYLPFTDNSALTTSSNVGLGKDFSGNGNYWTTNNISITAGVTYDSMTDVPTLTSATASNFAVANPVDQYLCTIAQGNLNVTTNNGGYGGGVRSTIAVSSGKWYWESVITVLGGTAGQAPVVGIIPSTTPINAIGSNTRYAYYGGTGNKLSSAGSVAYGATFSTGDVIGYALDLDAGTLTFYKNNTSQGTAFTGLSGSFCAAVYDPSTGGTTAINFGQRPFTYTPPTGFVALNAYNLPTSTIVKGNTVMDATLYTGTGASLSVTNTASFKPDLVWVKSRSAATDHAWYDSVRGTTKQLESNTTTAETTEATGLTAFGSAGFTVGALAQMNTSAATYVGWQWQAGQGSSSSNTNGTITSTVSVNASAGFSVVTYTGTGVNATVGHGLGVALGWLIVKRRTTAGGSWVVWHSAFAGTERIDLDSTAAKSTDATAWNSTSPSSSVFSIGTSGGTNLSAATYVAYCWTPIAGFSAFGSISANGAADNAFVYTGFLPRFVLMKRTDSTSNWYIWDTARNTFNVFGNELYPNLSNAEASATDLDVLSNGFKLRSASFSGTWIYAAFATAPFKNSLGF